jgi:hypothetical protein
MLCGYRRDTAIADWGRCDGETLTHALGLTHDKTPCAATLHHVLRKLDGALVEAALGAWAERVRTTLPPAAGELEAIAIDGKTLRGNRKQGAPAVHLLAAFRHRLGLTIWQHAVADKTHEIPVMEAVWRGLLLEGRVITVDAWLSPRAIAHPVVEGGGDDVMLVKGHQLPLPHDIGLVFQEPIAPTEISTACDTEDHGHGRLEERRLTTSPALVGYRDWPGLAQVFHVERRVTVKKSGAQRAEVVYGVTRLSPGRASPEGLWRLVRQH